MTITPQPGILDIAPYVGGETALRHAKNPVRLTSNENPFGASPKAITAYHDFASRLHLYAPGDAEGLRLALAEKYTLKAENIVCGNGSDELLHLLCQAYVGAGDTVLYSAHGFLVYPIATRACSGIPIPVPDKDLTADLDAMLLAVQDNTRIVFLANPNNPTGTYLAIDALRAFRRQLPAHVLLVLDCAYAEYVTAPDFDCGYDLVTEFNNVVVTRTFSKIYGLAGIRLGWGYMSAAVADVLNRIRPPFNVSGPAQAAGIAALQDDAHMLKAREHNTLWRDKATVILQSAGFSVTPSQGNFILLNAGNHAQTLYDYLCSHEVFIRRVKAYGLPQCLRVTIGVDHDMQRFLDLATQFAAQNGMQPS